MGVCHWAITAACIATLTFASLTGPVAAQSPLSCDRNFARTILPQGNYDAFCSCQTITKPFVRATQRNQNFPDILKIANQSCPELAKFLSEVDTATIDADDVYGDDGDPGGGGGGDPGDGGGPGGGVDNGW